jgi:hypothetical protein
MPLANDASPMSYRTRVHELAHAIAGKLAQIATLHSSPGTAKRRRLSTASEEVRVVIVSPRDVVHEGRLLRNRVQKFTGVSSHEGELLLVPMTLRELLGEPFATVVRTTSLELIVIVAWCEPEVPVDENDAASLLMLDDVYRKGMQRGSGLVVYRCNRGTSFRPDDPNLDFVLNNVRAVNQFFAMFQESQDERVLYGIFHTEEELLARFDEDMRMMVQRAIEMRARNAQVRAVESTEPKHPVADLGALLGIYLRWVVDKHEMLELRGIGGASSLARVALDDVYVALRGVRAPEHERHQSTLLLQAELRNLMRVLPEGASPLDIACLMDEAETRAVVANPLMPFLIERDRPASDAQVGEVTLTLADAFRSERSLVVLGDPGSGKTTLLRWIARRMANGMLESQQKGDPDLRVEVLAHQVDPRAPRDSNRHEDLGVARLPVLVRVSEFAEEMLQARKNGGTLSLADFLGAHTWNGEACRGETDALKLLIRSFLQQGRCVVLLDGMDEVTASSNRSDVVHAIETFISEWMNLSPRGARAGFDLAGALYDVQGAPGLTGGNQIVITSRIAGYHASPIAGLIAHVTVQPMQPQAIRHFCDAWTETVYGAGSAERARLESEQLKAEIFSPDTPQLWELASNPLLITILALIYHREKHLPRQRSELYHAALVILIENWRVGQISTEEFVYVLSPLAAKIHTDYSTGLISEAEMREIITRELARYRGESPDDPPPQFVRDVRIFLRRVSDDVGLLAPRGPGVWGFLHLTFQEYLAALWLVRDRATAGQAIVDRLGDPRWREPILLALGHVSSSPEWGPVASSTLLRQILDADDPLGRLVPRGPLLVIKALPEMQSVPDDLVGELLDRILPAYVLSANDDTSTALARQIEKAINAVYASRHKNRVVDALARLLGAASRIDEILACANLIRANGWQDDTLLPYLLRVQPYDDSKWSLPITDILRRRVTPLAYSVDMSATEDRVEGARRDLEAACDGSLERVLRDEVAVLTEQVTELERNGH